jgi:Concanavalin A-like lectin/glucanases superfamily
MAFNIPSGFTVSGNWNMQAYDAIIGDSLLYNLDMQNYSASATTWIDSSSNGYTFTFYTGNNGVTPTAPSVTGQGTNQAYFTTSSTSWAKAPSAIMNSSVAYTKGAVVRGHNTVGAPFGAGYLQCTSEARDTTWFNNGQAIFCAGNHLTSSYTDVAQNVGTCSLNTWYYVSVSFDPGGGWKIYVNGALVGVSATTAVGPTTATPVIAATQALPGFVGDIAAAHCYRRALTQLEHYQNASYWLTRYNGSNPS